MEKINTDDLLVKILSFLPTKVAVTTSILSKRGSFFGCGCQSLSMMKTATLNLPIAGGFDVLSEGHCRYIEFRFWKACLSSLVLYHFNQKISNYALKLQFLTVCGSFSLIIILIHTNLLHCHFACTPANRSRPLHSLMQFSWLFLVWLVFHL